MRLIRKSTSQTVTLSDGFLWSDEFNWQAKQQNHKYAVDGALIVQEGEKKSGRPITLTAMKDMAWIKRRDLVTLQEWALLEEQFTLRFEYQHDVRQFNVIFNHAATAIEAVPVKEFPTVSEDDYYNATLKFLEVEDGN